MLRWNAVLMLLFLYPSLLRAGEPLYLPLGADAMGMAFAVTASPGHWNGFHNPALLKLAPSSGLAAGAESRFMMPELSTRGVSALLAAGNAPVGLVVTHFGNGDYHRIFAGAASAVRLGDGLSLGVRADYITERAVGDYRDLSHVTFGAGLAWQLSPTLRLGFSVFNPVSTLNTLPSSIDAGLAWEESERLIVALDLHKVSNEPLSVSIGAGWNIRDRITLRTGYMSSPSAFSFGTGFRVGPLQADIGFLLYSTTGMTSSVSLLWRIK